MVGNFMGDTEKYFCKISTTEASKCFCKSYVVLNEKSKSKHIPGEFGLSKEKVFDDYPKYDKNQFCDPCKVIF